MAKANDENGPQAKSPDQNNGNDDEAVNKASDQLQEAALHKHGREEEEPTEQVGGCPRELWRVSRGIVATCRSANPKKVRSISQAKLSYHRSKTQ
ncbi:hypothetical protein Y032_0004g1922 [Ancylostoma ceylanicum]|uniref:Uncharacterized protein n=1 Tax=Ancylostoma ceylanicum TaxID=53326 RepID=A0A016VU17_9BILA|nr:hypothetical protein Y032_0004g1922 [Ancylostoma ceylanicum]